MTPAFASWSDFFAMGGYALYVWLAVGITLFSLLVLSMQTLWQRKCIFADIKRRIEREKRISHAEQLKAEQTTEKAQ